MALITLIVFLPTLGALAIAFMPSKKDENGVNEKDNQNFASGVHTCGWDSNLCC